GGSVSSALNWIPGMNAVSFFHDTWTYGENNLFTSLLKAIPSAVAVYIAAYDEFRNYYSQGKLGL
ncbi:hypothetical protein EB093_07015, partial [bacterium]|nr:hypothetical protein [bacterium]